MLCIRISRGGCFITIDKDLQRYRHIMVNNMLVTHHKPERNYTQNAKKSENTNVTLSTTVLRHN